MSPRRIAIELAWRVPVVLTAGAVILLGLIVLSGIVDSEVNHSPAFYAAVGSLLIGVGTVTVLPVVTIGVSRPLLSIVGLTAALSLQLVPFEVLLGQLGFAIRLALLAVGLGGFVALRSSRQRQSDASHDRRTS